MLTAVAMDDVMQDLKQLAAELLSAASDDDENEVTWRQWTDLETYMILKLS